MIQDFKKCQSKETSFKQPATETPVQIEEVTNVLYVFAWEPKSHQRAQWYLSTHRTEQHI